MRKNKLHLYLLLLSNFYLNSCSKENISILDKVEENNTFIKIYGGSDFDLGFSITNTNDGGFAIAGRTLSNDGDFKEINKGLFDGFFLKLNSNGEKVWVKSFGGSNDDEFKKIIETLDGGLILVGNTKSADKNLSGLNKGESDVLIVKSDKSGNIEWTKIIGGSNNDYGNDIIQHKNNGYYLVGQTASRDKDFNNIGREGDEDFFVANIDLKGNLVFVKKIIGSGQESGESISISGDNQLVVTGFSGSQNGDFIEFKTGSFNSFVLKMDLLGNKIWLHNFGEKYADKGVSIVNTKDGGFAFTGTSESNETAFISADIFVKKISSTGKIEWETKFIGSEMDSPYSIIEKKSGDLIICGATNSKDGDFSTLNKFSNAVIILSLNKDGTKKWIRSFNGEANQRANSVIEATNGGIVITGFSSSNQSDFLNLNKGKSDIFCLKLNSNGDFK